MQEDERGREDIKGRKDTSKVLFCLTHTQTQQERREVPSLPLSASFNCCPGRQDDGSHVMVCPCVGKVDRTSGTSTWGAGPWTTFSNIRLCEENKLMLCKLILVRGSLMPKASSLM